MHTESTKMVLMNPPAGQQLETQTEQACGHWGTGSVRQMESIVWKRTLPRVKWRAGRNLLHDPGDSDWGPVTTWAGAGGGACRPWLSHADI